MKKLVVFAVLGLIAAVILAAPMGYKPLAVEVPETSVMVLPGVIYPRTNAWAASTAYTRDTIFYVSNRFYWVTSAGTSWTNGPTHTDGDSTNGTATMRYVRPVRNGFTICNIGTGRVFVAYVTAEATKGIMLLPNGAGVLSGLDYPGAVYAISTTATTNTLVIHEE